MTVSVKKVARARVLDWLSDPSNGELNSAERDTFRRCLGSTLALWMGTLDGELICIWGLVPPTLSADVAYLWLYTSEKIKGHEFLFIRHSQLAVQQMLERYPTITGVTRLGREKTIRWLRWLGCEFGDPQGDVLPFVIRKK